MSSCSSAVNLALHLHCNQPFVPDSWFSVFRFSCGNVTSPVAPKEKEKSRPSFFASTEATASARIVATKYIAQFFRQCDIDYDKFFERKIHGCRRSNEELSVPQLLVEKYVLDSCMNLRRPDDTDLQSGDSHHYIYPFDQHHNATESIRCFYNRRIIFCYSVREKLVFVLTG